MIMNYVHPLRLPRLRTFKAFVYYNLCQTKVPVGRIANIELTNRCNQRCAFCPANNSDVKKPVCREKKDISMNDFERLLVKYKKYMGVVCISHHGESFLHPKFDEAIKLLKKYGVRYTITTNGSLVGKHISSLTDYPPETMLFSLYTINPEKFKRITRNGDVRIVLQNIGKLIELKKQHKIHTKIVVRIIKMRGFEEDLDQVLDFFKNRDVAFDVNVLNSWAGRVDIDKFGDSVSNIVKFKYCFQPWEHCIIGSDLGVYVCNNHEDRPVGYLTDSTLDEIWNSVNYQTIRKNILEGNFRKNSMCFECDYFLLGCAVNKPSVFFLLDPFFWKTFLFGIGIYKVKDQAKLLDEYKKRYSFAHTLQKPHCRAIHA